MYNVQLNYSTILMLEETPEYFYDNIEIASVFDSFPVIWNGGRIVSGHMNEQMIEYGVPRIFKMFNDKGVACRLTFSNPLIEEKHLDDPASNRILQLAENGMNGAIVASDVLESYIRTTYPRVKITSSTCKQLRSLDEISTELAKGYGLVVLDYNVNRDDALLKAIPHKDRCEILVNAICNPDCPRRGKHYRYIGDYQLEHCGPQDAMRTSFAGMDWKCENLKKDVFARRESPNYLSPKDIYEKLVPMGYRNFKLEGRGNPFLDLIEQYVYFMVKPQWRDVVRYRLINDVLALRGATA